MTENLSCDCDREDLGTTPKKGLARETDWIYAAFSSSASAFTAISAISVNVSSVILLRQGSLQQVDRGVETELFRPSLQRAVSGDFVMSTA